MSETLWRRDKEQLPSAETLLRGFGDDVNVFEVEEEEGVQQLCWGMKKIREKLRGKVAEIRVDATCKFS